jgi:hypothetical protein
MVSSIYTAQNNGFMSDIWKFSSNFYFAFITSLYILFFYLILNNHVFQHQLDFLQLNILENRSYNFLITILIYIIIPVMILNYYLILKDDNYKSLMKKFKSSCNKKIFGIYFAIGFLLIFFYVASRIEFRR